MDSDEKILSFMDLLDLDEELIDLRMKNLMSKSKFTNGHLNNLTHLLHYKHMINMRESSECENDIEYDFIGRLIINANEVNVDYLCKVVTSVLTLQPSSIVHKSEHLIQQILADMYLPSISELSSAESETGLSTTFQQLKICGSILEAVVKCNTKLSLPFLDIPLEHLILCRDEKLLVYFLNITVSQLFRAITGYNILDRIWIFLQSLGNVGESIPLKVLCCLSNYYLPVQEYGKISSDIITYSEFWDFLLLGFLSGEPLSRKQAVYLAKRAIDYAMKTETNISISSKSTFHWDNRNKVALKKMWDNFFILIDSLEEKQSNIVLPSLTLFDSIRDLGHCWLNCAFHIGLKHDNTQVRLKCLDYRLKFSIHNESEAVRILEAINDIALFVNANEYNYIIDKLCLIIKDKSALIFILKAVPSIKWSPVPLYHLTAILTNIKGVFSHEDQIHLIDIIYNLIKVPCNNIFIRKAVHINISQFIANCCKELAWSKYIPLISVLNLDTEDANINNPFKNFIREQICISHKDREQILEQMFLSSANADFALLSLEKYADTTLSPLINGTVEKILDVSKRQYCDKNDCWKEVIFLTYLYKKTIQIQHTNFYQINMDLATSLKAILKYIESTLASDITLDIEKMTFWFENLDYLVSNKTGDYHKESLLQLYKTAILLLCDSNIDLDKKVLSIYVLSTTLKSSVVSENYKQEIIDIKSFVDIILNVKLNECGNKENSGRMRNVFYEKVCEITDTLLMQENLMFNNNIINFIETVTESGGYGCLKWILRIMNKVLPRILKDKEIKLNVTQFLATMWKELEELKSNNQYAICMEEFVNLLTIETLLISSKYNNIVLLYCSKIIDYSSIKNMPLYFLAKQMNGINISRYSHMVYVLSEILLYPVVPRKDNRITENVLLEVLQKPVYGVDRQQIYFNSHIQFLAVSILSRISGSEVLNTLMSFMTKKVDELFKNKQRYHGNSQLQRMLQACIQNLLLIMLKSREVNLNGTAVWCMELLGRIPHQPFIRTCLEWYTALYFYVNENLLDEELLNRLKSKNVPLQSQFVIMYWIAIHKLKVGKCTIEEYEFVMDFLLSHTMGPVFSIRLYAQYLATKLYDTNELSNNLDNQRYSYMIKVIKQTLEEAAKVEDKSYMKILNDYFVKHFDIVGDLTPCAIYWSLPLLTDSLSSHAIEDDFFRNILGEIDESVNLGVKDKFYGEWKERHRMNSDVFYTKENNKVTKKTTDNLEEPGTIQKKYVPWKNMSDIEVYQDEKKRNKSDLIVVASLIDKLPNLGGMARTSEVFGVLTYVVDSVRHLQDKQFQGLSVSAERWVKIEEVRPGKPLKDYLVMKKSEGYSMVAAEQTSISTNLQNFKFPKKTLLLLGHEKEGVPCDLLPLMDHCVEIPQQGVIRSLNVHVTAAIFIWEYARQNML